MVNLTETLRRQHVAIVEIAQAIQSGVDRSELAVVQAELKRLEIALTAHLALEDAELYPRLTRVAKETNSEHLALVAGQFSPT